MQMYNLIYVNHNKLEKLWFLKPKCVLNTHFLSFVYLCFCNFVFFFFFPQFGEPSESTDTVMSEEQADLMQIQPITLNPPVDILSDSRKSDNEDEK